jgi:deazaflavin-dependent oxidoreductase (nitroreductase family)
MVSVKTTKSDQKNVVSMDGSEVQKALDSSVELQITVTGRKSGREFSTPVWFVREGKTIYLMPVRGSKNQWYKNVLKSKRIKISSGRVSLELAAKPINDSKRVGSIADKFRKKHGVADVKRYYARFDAAVELNLP